MTSTPETPPVDEAEGAVVAGKRDIVVPEVGLTSEQVAGRVAAGQVNGMSTTSGRSVVQILWANVATRFNAILGTLFVVILIVGPIKDGVFGLVLVVNITGGVVQDVR